MNLPPVKEGDEVLVQVVKDPIGSKGPRLTRHISFPGRFLVFMPGIDHVGISRKITEPEERERLRSLIKGHAQPGEGFIVRTAAIGEKDEDLVSDVAFLRELWAEAQLRTQESRPPALVWQDSRLLQKVLRDLFREEVASFWVDQAETYREVVDFVGKLHPEWVERVKHFTSDLPIFEAFAIEKEIEAARHPKVFLKHGGSIVINQTEALVSVDVNTGKFVGKKDLEETVYLTNREAIPEIIRQLRLRNLGGIIVIDFIDMMDPGPPGGGHEAAPGGAAAGPQPRPGGGDQRLRPGGDDPQAHGAQPGPAPHHALPPLRGLRSPAQRRDRRALGLPRAGPAGPAAQGRHGARSPCTPS